MTDTPPVPPESKLERWLAHTRTLVDLLKIVVVLIIGLVVVWNQSFSTNAQACSVNSRIAEVLKSLPVAYREELGGFIAALYKDCAQAGIDPAVVKVLQDPDAVPVASLRPFAGSAFTVAVNDEVRRILAEGKGQTATEAPPVTVPSTPTEKKQAVTEGWVAVGFVGSDKSFSLPPGRDLTTLAAKDEIVALGPVNLRRKAADWTSPLAVVATGRRVEVLEAPKRLRAGDLEQVWAHVVLR